MIAEQMGIEQGGASDWSADSNCRRQAAIEMVATEAQLDCRRLGWLAGWGGVVQSPRDSWAQVLSEDREYFIYILSMEP